MGEGRRRGMKRERGGREGEGLKERREREREGGWEREDRRERGRRRTSERERRGERWRHTLASISLEEGREREREESKRSLESSAECAVGYKLNRPTELPQFGVRSGRFGECWCCWLIASCWHDTFFLMPCSIPMLCIGWY